LKTPENGFATKEFLKELSDAKKLTTNKKKRV